MLSSGNFDYNMVKRWGTKVIGGNIFKMRKVFVPVNANGNHWCLCVADIENKVFFLRLCCLFLYSSPSLISRSVLCIINYFFL
jgi:Ulp1 family protease